MALSPQSLLLVSPVLIGDVFSVLWSRVVCLTNSAESLGVAQVSGMTLHHFFSMGKNHPLSRRSSAPHLPLAQALSPPRTLTLLQPLIKGRTCAGATPFEEDTECPPPSLFSWSLEESPGIHLPPQHSNSEHIPLHLAFNVSAGD